MWTVVVAGRGAGKPVPAGGDAPPARPFPRKAQVDPDAGHGDPRGEHRHPQRRRCRRRPYETVLRPTGRHRGSILVLTYLGGPEAVWVIVAAVRAAPFAEDHNQRRAAAGDLDAIRTVSPGAAGARKQLHRGPATQRHHTRRAGDP